jgi:hypothetical protein
MTRQRWMMVGALLAGIVIASGVALAVSGGDDEETTPTTTTSSSTTTTTAAPPTTATTPVTVAIICTTPEDAAMSFVNAWIAGDQAAAARCANQESVNTIFQTSGAGANYTWQGCFGDDPALPTCSYTYEGGAINLAVRGTEASGWKVESVSYFAD